MPDSEFDDLALRVFRFQYEHNRPFRGFVDRRGVEHREVEAWEMIPFLPTGAFKAATLVSGEAQSVQRVFRTSGTTGGRELRGAHHVRDLDLYRENLLPNLRAHLLPDVGEVRQEEDGERLPILCLLPSAEVAADSSLSFMMAEAIRSFGADSSGFFVGPQGSVEAEAFRRALEKAEGGMVPVLLAGTAFSFVSWTEEALEKGWGVTLPPGSRIMETGGYKGRRTELPRTELYRSLTDAFGVPEGRIVNEYGMTELLSQFYEPVLGRGRADCGEGFLNWGRERLGEPVHGEPEVAPGDAAPDLEERFLVSPPWMRTLVLDPMTLATQSPGQVGVLAHLDLANLGSVSAILTDDLGIRVPGGFKLVGRTPGSEPRGCSLAMEDFLASRGTGARDGRGS
jgi:hypothetical protein